jgi:flavin-dependent dehydrogenase
MIKSSVDVAVIGGGPAGSALAALLARGDLRVELLERDTFPRDKLCGEFLSGESQRLLGRLGCLERILELRPPKLERARFTTARGRVVEAPLPDPALGISRRALDVTLFQHASDCGARAAQGTDVVAVTPAASAVRLEVRRRDPDAEDPSTVEAAWVVGAHGRRERLDRKLQRRFLERTHPYLGLKRHFRPVVGDRGDALRRELTGWVEVHAFEGGYCGLNFIETGEVNVCMLLEKRAATGLESTRWDAVASHLSCANLHLGKRLAALEPSEDSVHSVGQVPFTPKERGVWPILFVGDAAGVITPLCGDGQAMALESAVMLGSLLLDAPREATREDWDEMFRRWDRLWRREFQRRIRLGRALQAILLRCRWADPLVGLVRHTPFVARYLARATRGRA